MKFIRRPRSIRARLTLTYVGAMLVVLAVYGVVVYASVRSNLSQALDTKLHDDLTWPTYMMSEEMVKRLLNKEGFDETVTERSPWLQVWEQKGETLLGRTPAARADLIPEAAALAKVADGKIRRLEDVVPPHRILTGKTQVAG